MKSGRLLVSMGLVFAACTNSGSEATTTSSAPAPTSTSSSLAPTTTTTLVATDAPDLILHNGKVITVDSEFSIAEALAVTDGLISAVGTTDDVLALADEATDIVDLDGRALIPGIVDPHTHLLQVVAPSLDQMEGGQRHLLSWGVTTAGMPSVLPEQLEGFRQMEADGALAIRSHIYLAYNSVCGEPIPDFYLSQEFESDPGQRLAIRGVKIFSDGGVCNAMTMSIPYPDTVPADFRDRFQGTGDLYVDRAEIASVVTEVDAAGGATVIHAAGDLAMAEALHGIDMAGPLTQPHQIHHNSLAALLDEDTLRLYGSNGLTPVVFLNRWANACDPANGDFFASILAPGVMSVIEDRRPISDANPDIRFSWHGDAPSLPASPLEQMFSLVTAGYSQDGEFCYPPRWADMPTIDATEALQMTTINAAMAMGLDTFVGSIEPGKIADLAILAADPLGADAEVGLATNRVLATLIGGENVHCVEICALFGVDTTVDPYVHVSTSEGCFDSAPTTWWPLEGDTSDRVGNLAGQAVGPVSYATGVVGDALIVSEGGVALSRSPRLANGFTIEFWVRFDGTSFDDFQTIFNNNQMFIRKNNSAEGNGMAAFVTLDDGSVEERAQTGPLTAGVWYHVAATWDGDELTIFLNGEAASSVPRSGVMTDREVPAHLGQGEGEGTDGVFLHGALDEVAFYDSPLGADAVRSVFAAGDSGRCQ